MQIIIICIFCKHILTRLLTPISIDLKANVITNGVRVDADDLTLRLEVKNLFDAFQQLENSGNQVDPSILSGGIWLALLTTGVGLAVATPTVAINSFFEHRLERAQPLPKFPTEMKEDKLHLTLPIQFALR